MLNAHRSSCVKFLGAYSYFRAQAELVAISETCAGVPIDGGAVDFADETHRFLKILRKYAVTVFGAVLVYMSNGFG